MNPPRPTSGSSTRDPALSVSPPRSKRVLITGVGRFWGANLARQLERDHSLDFVCGVDSRDPLGEFGRTEVVKGDIRNPSISRLINVTRVDTVVHTQVFGADRPGEPGRLLHDMNVIGTMNLLAACAASPFVRKVIIRSSTAIYGASPKDPAFFTEDMESKGALRDTYSRDIAEVETYARDFAERAPHAAVTILRFANSIGENVDTALTKYLMSQVVPTHAGYNPRLQFIHETDAVDALAHAVRSWRPGTFNVAGPGAITLGRFLRMAGRVNVPLIPPMFGPALHLLERTNLLYVPSRYDRTLKFGRGVSTDRMINDFGFVPEYTTTEAAEKFAAWIRTRRYHEGNDVHLDRELLDYVQKKMQQMPSLDASLFGRIAPRFDPDRTPAGGSGAEFTSTAVHVRADAGLDDDDDDAAPSTDDGFAE
ncbi:MAG: NAD-dependent epimerase/dehydratase [Thermoleophilia bacterium]|nr:NAD-dependent epimerase/dehydratase [Thermoleophilia bacterium]